MNTSRGFRDSASTTGTVNMVRRMFDEDEEEVCA